jgi:hypothetical protein
MNPHEEYGQTTPVPVNILPELAWDVSEGQPLPTTLGKTEAPVVILPELVCDLKPVEPVPALQLRLSLRTGSPPGEVALDLFRLYTALNQLELSHRGSGLTLEDALCDVLPTNGTMRITFKPTDPNGAADRLTELVRVINEMSTNEPGLRQPYRSIERWEAQMVPVAA